MIKTILIIIVLGLLLYFVRNRNTMKLRASKKILFVVFVVCATVAIVNPTLTSDVAQSIGVGRGADLLLYGVVLAFSFVTLNIYLKFKDYDDKIAKLTRAVAIANATTRTTRSTTASLKGTKPTRAHKS